MNANEAIRALDAFFVGAGFQTPGAVDFDELDLKEPPEEECENPEESVRDSDKVSYEERLAECACEGPEFEEYVKIYNGDRTLAEYWFKKWKVGWER